MIRIFMQMNITVHYLCVLQDPVRLLPQHGLVHAHPRHGHVQRDPYLRHDKWHLLQVRHELSHSRYPLPHLPSSILAWKMHAFLQNFENSIHIHPSAGQSQPPITTVCPVTFPMPQFGFNGWVSMLKSILGSLCREYHYVSLPRIPSRQQSLFGCGWLGSSTPNSSSALSFICISGPSSSLWLRGEWLLSDCEAMGGMTNKMLLLWAWLLSLKSSQPWWSRLLSQLYLSSLYPPNQTLLPNAHWKSCFLSSLCSPCTAGAEIKTHGRAKR